MEEDLDYSRIRRTFMALWPDAKPYTGPIPAEEDWLTVEELEYQERHREGQP